MSDKESDKYDVVEKIGQGSFGVINKVRRKQDGQVLCRKEISYLRMSQKEREQLSAELQILKELRHPNIVAYYNRAHDKETSDVHLYMEYCGNGDLGMVIKNLRKDNKFADEEFIWSMFSQIVSALYRCHYGEDPPEVGGISNVLKGGRPARPQTKTVRMILHRDLKPENIFLGEDNSVKLGDFGLSKIIAAHDFASTYVGTPFYMSPEICGAERYTLYSDIWSLGCIMYELCTKEPPFNARTHFELIQKIKSGRTAPLPMIYSDELKNVIASCLRVDPSKRPDTAQLVNLPVVKLMRKEAEAVSLGQQLRCEKEKLAGKTREVEDRLRNIDSKIMAAKQETDDRLRREWEVRAQLEIQKQVQAHTDRLNEIFEAELERRIQVEVSKRVANIQSQSRYVESRTPPRPRVTSNASNRTKEDEPINPTKSWSTLGEASEFPSQTDLSELSDLSLESPLMARKGPRPSFSGNDLGNRPARTPFTRARTMMDPAPIPSPMDVHMADPSPVSVSALNLSPRRTQPGAQPVFGTAASDAAVVAAGRDIFAAAAAAAKWEPTNASTLPSLSDVEDSDDDDADDGDDEKDIDSSIPVLPSPTRKVSDNMDPFKPRPTSRPATRPSLGRQKTTPNPLHRVNGQHRLASAPSLFKAANQAESSASAQVKSRANSSVPIVAASPTRKAPASPNRSSPRKAAAAGLAAAAGNTVSTKDFGLPSKKGNEALRRNAPQGRTLIELAQARAGGRDLGQLSAATDSENDTQKPKRAVRASLLPDPANWDAVDEKPSPFLKKAIKIIL